MLVDATRAVERVEYHLKTKCATRGDSPPLVLRGGATTRRGYLYHLDRGIGGVLCLERARYSTTILLNISEVVDVALEA